MKRSITPPGYQSPGPNPGRKVDSRHPKLATTTDQIQFRAEDHVGPPRAARGVGEAVRCRHGRVRLRPGNGRQVDAAVGRASLQSRPRRLLPPDRRSLQGIREAGQDLLAGCD